MSIPYRNPIIRDLAWVLRCPPILCAPHFIDEPFLASFSAPIWPQLSKLDARAEPQLCTINRRTRLGHYYEQLLVLAFSIHPDYTLLAKDLCVHEQKRTIGSADFILWNKQHQRHEHWEVALKFYLGTGDTTQTESWVGPGKKDCLSNKLERLTEHQIKLLQTQEGQRLCKQHGWEIDSQKVLLQGRLYSPDESECRPDGVNRRAVRGRWYTQQQLPDNHWYHLSRCDWLAAPPAKLLPQYQTPEAFDYPQHIISSDLQQRAFVVPDNW